MNIIFGIDKADEIKDKYVMLELDTIKASPETEPVTAYCILEQIPLLELAKLDELKDLHSKLIANYKLKNWNYCTQALEHLMPCWGGELKSFYEDLFSRIEQLRTQTLDPDWDGIIKKY
jgi:hypothetical protein